MLILPGRWFTAERIDRPGHGLRKGVTAPARQSRHWAGADGQPLAVPFVTPATLAEDAAQPHTNPAVQALEGGTWAMLEISEPTAKGLGQSTEIVLESGFSNISMVMRSIPGLPPLALTLAKASAEVTRGADLIHQAVPLTSSHPVFQGRQHTFRPDARSNPGPSVTDLSGRFSPPLCAGHWSRLFLPVVFQARIHLPASSLLRARYGVSSLLWRL